MYFERKLFNRIVYQAYLVKRKKKKKKRKSVFLTSLPWSVSFHFLVFVVPDM